VPETRALARLRYAPNQDAKIARCRLELQRRFWAAVRFGRILEPPPDRGCVRRTSRSKCGCAKSLNDPKTRGLAVSLRLVLRTQPRSVSARFWWWYQDAPANVSRNSGLLVDLHGRAAGGRGRSPAEDSGARNSFRPAHLPPP